MELLESPKHTYFSALPDDLLNILKLYYSLSYPVNRTRDYNDMYYQSADGRWYNIEGYLWSGYDHMCVVEDENYDLIKPFIADMSMKENLTAHHYIFISRKIKFNFYIDERMDAIYDKIASFITNHIEYCGDPSYHAAKYYKHNYYLIDNRKNVYISTMFRD